MQFEGSQVVVVVGDWLVDFVAALPISLCHTGPEGRQSLRVQSLRGAVAVEGGEGGHERPDRKSPWSCPPRLPAD